MIFLASSTTVRIYLQLEQALHSLVINPLEQRLDEWNWVMEWTDLLAPAALVGLLSQHFFPKWLQVLASWLNNNPNYVEVKGSKKNDFWKVHLCLNHEGDIYVVA